MNTDAQSRRRAGQAQEKILAARRPTAIVPWVVVAVLLLTNIVALLDGRVHSAAQAFFGPAISMMFGDPTGLFPDDRRLGRSGRDVQSAESLARQNATLIKRGRQLESAITRLERENSEVKARKAATDGQLVKVQLQHATLRNAHSALEAERSALKNTLEMRGKAVKTVADRVSRKLAVQAGGLIAELPVRAAPYVGVLAIITGATLDIQSDCELARTLNGLVLEHQQAPLDTHAVCRYTDRIPSPEQLWTTVKKRSGTLAAPLLEAVEKLY